MRLEHSSIIAEINNKLQYQGDIKIVALIDIGGTGKTTVDQKANIVLGNQCRYRRKPCSFV